MTSTGIDPFALVLLPLLAIVLPAIGVWDFRRMVRRIRAGVPNARRNIYIWTIALMWPLTMGLLAWWLLDGRGLEAVRMIPTVTGWQWLGVAAGAAIAAYMVLQMHFALRSREQLEQVRRQSGKMCEMAPRTPLERRLFLAVSITAGVCEEILYRGLLIAVLTPGLGLWPTVLVSSLIFGLGHVYQGWKAIATTGATGLLMALLALGSGSILVPMILHAVVDATGGRLLGAAMRSAPAKEVSQPAAQSPSVGEAT